MTAKEGMKKRINTLIAKRTRYGIRVEVANAPGYILTWWNGSRSWSCDYKIQKGERIELDANQIFVSGKKNEIDAVISTLDDLPLYKESFESRMRGGR